MHKNSLAVITLAVLILIFILHWLGMSEYLYINYWFYDIIMHILGGIGIGLSALYAFNNTKYIIISTIICGIIWELFEMYYNISGAPIGSKYHILDTIKDLFDDTIGAIILWLIVQKNNIKENI